ncbi:hypothetical protein SEVIR_2G455700v4 [Setaria viridis]|uniref:Glycosyltransferases n=1 Tax=Setaria viridis TaxID=4556 RepID=A0A4U6W3R6_SETVI|nr:probable beta-1,4-xylosyltransferase IRX9 [Setaria viridis]TKW36682.1 hypothetical protein SEVIR_2G455700v2 [Setaria viridis]
MASPKHNPTTCKQIKKKQRPLVLRRAMLHSCACFLVGLVTGLAPSDWADAASRAAADANTNLLSRAARAMNHTEALLTTHYQLLYQQPPQQQQQGQEQEQRQVQVVVIVITTTAGFSSSDRERRSAGLTRTAHALRLASPPVVWLVVEAAREAAPTAALLRRTGVLYRHLTYADNFTSSDSDDAWEEERHHQRNVALAHIEQHRLRGVVIFAGLADVYDIRLLENLRHIRTLGAWAVATVWQQQRRVAVEGPVCVRNTTTAAWFSSSTSSTSDSVHGFAFASHLLWDPARWDRFPTSEPDQSQDSIKFVQRLLVEDYNETTPVIPAGCSSPTIMAWRLVDTTLLL